MQRTSAAGLAADLDTVVQHVLNSRHRFDFAAHFPGPNRDVVQKALWVVDVDAIDRVAGWVQTVNDTNAQHRKVSRGIPVGYGPRGTRITPSHLPCGDRCVAHSGETPFAAGRVSVGKSLSRTLGNLLGDG